MHESVLHHCEELLELGLIVSDSLASTHGTLNEALYHHVGHCQEVGTLYVSTMVGG